MMIQTISIVIYIATSVFILFLGMIWIAKKEKQIITFIQKREVKKRCFTAYRLYLANHIIDYALTNKILYRQLAKQFGISQRKLKRILKGKVNLKLSLLFRIQGETGVRILNNLEQITPKELTKEPSLN